MFKKGLFLLLIPFLFSCGKKISPEGEKPKILVTLSPYNYFVERIAGNTVEVQTLVPPGMNIHIYEPSPKHVEETIQSKVWFRIDEPFEQKILQFFKEQNPSLEVISLQEGLDLIPGDDVIELERCEGHSHGGKDLHTWLSPKLVLEQSEKIFKTLSSLFPENQSLYETNFKQFEKDLRTLDSDIQTLLAPFKGDAILVSHPALGYFCKDYGLVQLSVECEGKEPRPKDIEKILKKTETYTILCTFLQQGFDNRGAQLIGKKLGLPIYEINPYASDYLKNLREIAGYIAK